MNEKRKRVYLKPESKVYPMISEKLLQQASGNAGTIKYGGGGGDAKKATGDWEEDDEFWSEDENGNDE